MIEKVIASCLAIITWFILYRVLYTQSWSPGLPGENGPFKYVTFQSKFFKYPNKRDKCDNPNKCDRPNKGEKWKKQEVPKFMGMPIYPQHKPPKPEPKADESSSSPLVIEPNYGKPLRNRSRSSSRVRLFDSKSSLNLRSSTYF